MIPFFLGIAAAFGLSFVFVVLYIVKTKDWQNGAIYPYADPGSVSAEERWNKFITHLNATEVLDRAGKSQHTNFLGSVESYRKVYMEANKT